MVSFHVHILEELRHRRPVRKAVGKILCDKGTLKKFLKASHADVIVVIEPRLIPDFFRDHVHVVTSLAIHAIGRRHPSILPKSDYATH